ncbi:SRPBCC family protein [Duganella sp. FT3S]|uniref:SRPBCC family protein n=1 Tax=Rugamonas fusca TaxID=2758568 RepID=A0A7W2I5I5_9BURK|nr:SRPBCC family protein [Rugamonas fusca]MBA5604476.1 SRPBCC family protein [Rugamonas fusca]
MRRIPVFGLALLVTVGAVLLAPLPLPPGTVRTSAVIARSPGAVFDYVTTPGNWPRWHPSSLAVAGATDHSLRVGEVVDEDFIVAGYQGRVRWTVVQRQVPERWAIAGQIEDGGSGKVSYRLTAVDGGTLFEREFDYARPNLLFLLADQLRVRRQVTAESAEALRRLKAVLEGQAPVPRMAGPDRRAAAGVPAS